jgi:hypothetical protein
MLQLQRRPAYNSKPVIMHTASDTSKNIRRLCFIPAFFSKTIQSLPCFYFFKYPAQPVPVMARQVWVAVSIFKQCCTYLRQQGCLLLHSLLLPANIFTRLYAFLLPIHRYRYMHRRYNLFLCESRFWVAAPPGCPPSPGKMQRLRQGFATR